MKLKFIGRYIFLMKNHNGPVNSESYVQANLFDRSVLKYQGGTTEARTRYN